MAMTANLLTGSGGAYGRVYVIAATVTTDTSVTVAPTSITTTPIVPRAWYFTPATVNPPTTTATDAATGNVFVTLAVTTGILTVQRAGGVGAPISTDTTVNGIGRLVIWDDMP
jgi:hypothetical protein